jgi:hypothetical protein
MSEGPLDQLVARMRQLQAAVHATLAELDRSAQSEGLRLPPQTLSPILNGERPPRWKTVNVFVRACAHKAKARRLILPAELLDLEVWKQLWEETQQGSSPAAEASASTPPPRNRPNVLIQDCTGVINGDYAALHLTLNYDGADQFRRE